MAERLGDVNTVSRAISVTCVGSVGTSYKRKNHSKPKRPSECTNYPLIHTVFPDFRESNKIRVY